MCASAFNVTMKNNYFGYHSTVMPVKPVTVPIPPRTTVRERNWLRLIYRQRIPAHTRDSEDALSSCGVCARVCASYVCSFVFAAIQVIKMTAMGRQHFFDHALQTYAFSELTTHESQADTEKSHVTKIKGCLKQTVHSEEEEERERERVKKKRKEK